MITLKKNIIIVLLSAMLTFIFFYMNFGSNVPHDTISTDDAPRFIKTAIKNNEEETGFSVFQDPTNTYIYYHSGTAGEYTTTDLNVKVKGGKYVATATVKSAVNIPNEDCLIKLDKISGRDLVLREKVK